MSRFCASCGTEVDDAAAFCPTCGQPIEEAEEADLPAAPAWPDPAASDLRPDEARRTAVEPDREPDEAPTRVEDRPPPVPPPPGVRDERSTDGGGLRSIDLPLTMPVTLSGWLVGIGSVLAVIGLVIILVVRALNVIDLLLLVGLFGVAATVFLAARLPAVPHLRLITLVVSLIAFGVAVDRIGFRGGGAGELLLFLGTAAAAIGAVILELGQDQPLGGPQR